MRPSQQAFSSTGRRKLAKGRAPLNYLAVSVFLLVASQTPSATEKFCNEFTCSKIERCWLRSVSNGKMDTSYGCFKAAKNRGLRSEVVLFAINNTHRGAISLENVVVDGDVQLRDAAAAVPILFENVLISGDLVFDSVDGQKRVRVVSSTIAGDVQIVESAFDHGFALLKSRVNGSVIISNSLFGRVLDLGNSSAHSVLIDECEVGSKLSLKGFRSRDQLAVKFTRVGGILDLHYAKAKSIWLSTIKISGQLALARAHVSESLELFRVTCEDRVWVNRAKIGGRFLVESSEFLGLILDGADFRRVSIFSVTLHEVLSIGDNRDDVGTDPMEWSVDGELRLDQVSTKQFDFDPTAGSWPASISVRAFEYETIGGYISRTKGVSPAETPSSIFIDWLELQAFRFENYRQMANVLAASDELGKASDIEFAGRMRQIKSKLSGGEYGPAIVLALLGVALGFGVKVWIALAPTVFFFGIGSIIAYRAIEIPAAKKERKGKDHTGLTAVAASEGKSVGSASGTHARPLEAQSSVVLRSRGSGRDSKLSRLLYALQFSLDRLVPVVTFMKEEDRGDPKNPWVKVYFMFHQAVGFVLTTAVVSRFTDLAGGW
jgi:hypothetical protein